MSSSPADSPYPSPYMTCKYPGSYCAERNSVYKGRKLPYMQRTKKALKAAEGNRLILKQPKNTK
jgi:hypothetical protein